MSPSTVAAPTARQLRYLRVLAANTGTTFAYPVTRGEASRQIGRLLGLKDEPPPRQQPGDLEAEQLSYATAVHASEVSGFGSSATWRAGSRPSIAPVLPTVQIRGSTELARYTVSAGQRILCGQRVNSSVRVTDRPSSGGGRSYLVESGMELDGGGALEALVADYVAQARELDEIPMATSAVRQLLSRAGRGA